MCDNISVLYSCLYGIVLDPVVGLKAVVCRELTLGPGGPTRPAAPGNPVAP